MSVETSFISNILPSGEKGGYFWMQQNINLKMNFNTCGAEYVTWILFGTPLLVVNDLKTIRSKLTNVTDQETFEKIINLQRLATKERYIKINSNCNLLDNNDLLTNKSFSFRFKEVEKKQILIKGNKRPVSRNNTDFKSKSSYKYLLSDYKKLMNLKTIKTILRV